jgi:hypothetical protein
VVWPDGDGRPADTPLGTCTGGLCYQARPRALRRPQAALAASPQPSRYDPLQYLLKAEPIPRDRRFKYCIAEVRPRRHERTGPPRPAPRSPSAAELPGAWRARHPLPAHARRDSLGLTVSGSGGGVAARAIGALAARQLARQRRARCVGASLAPACHDHDGRPCPSPCARCCCAAAGRISSRAGCQGCRAGTRWRGCTPRRASHASGRVAAPRPRRASQTSEQAPPL